MPDASTATALSKHSNPYIAPSEQTAKGRFDEFTADWGQRYSVILRLWECSWAKFVPFLEYDVEIRKVVSTTNAIEPITPATAGL